MRERVNVVVQRVVESRSAPTAMSVRIADSKIQAAARGGFIVVAVIQ